MPRRRPRWSLATSRPAVTSACSWAARRCASTGRECSLRCSGTRARVAVGKDLKSGGEPMADRKQRAEGKAEEVKGRAKRAAGAATGNRSTEASGAGDELKGKAKNAVGKARSAVKKSTR